MICTAEQILQGDQMVHQISWASDSNGEKGNGQEGFVEEVWRKEITWKVHM